MRRLLALLVLLAGCAPASQRPATVTATAALSADNPPAYLVTSMVPQWASCAGQIIGEGEWTQSLWIDLYDGETGTVVTDKHMSDVSLDCGQPMHPGDVCWLNAHVPWTTNAANRYFCLFTTDGPIERLYVITPP